MTSDDLRYDRQYVVSRPGEERAIIVPEPEWKRIVERLKSARLTTPFYDATGWGLVTLAATFFALSFSFVDGWAWGIRLAAIGVLFGGLMGLKYASDHRVDRDTVLRNVLDDLNAKLGTDEADTAGLRRTYRAIAYLREYVREAFENESPFEPDCITRWNLHSDVDSIWLHVYPPEEDEIRLQVDVAPDWPQGESWEYAVSLGRKLLENAPANLIAVDPDQWKGHKI